MELCIITGINSATVKLNEFSVTFRYSPQQLDSVIEKRLRLWIVIKYLLNQKVAFTVLLYIFINASDCVHR